MRVLASLRAKEPLSSDLIRAVRAVLGCGVPAFCPFPVLFSASFGVIRHVAPANAVLFFRKKSGFVIFSEVLLTVSALENSFF